MARLTPTGALITCGVLLVSVLASALSAVPAAADSAGSTVSVDPSQVSLLGSGYDGHSLFSSKGVEVSTTLVTGDDGSAAYATGRFPVDVPLPAASPTLSLQKKSGTTVPSMLLVVDFDGDGVPDGTLVGDPTSLPYWWLTPDSLQFVKNAAPTTSGCGSAWCGLMSDWSAPFPNATVLAAGYLLGPDVASDWQIASMTIGTTTYAFTNAVPDSQVLHAPDLDAALASDGTAGHIEFGLQSLDIYTDNSTSQAFVSQYFDLADPPLSQLGQPSLTWAANEGTPAPALQLVIDLGGPGSTPATLTQTPGAPDNWYAAATAPQAVLDRAPSCNVAPTCDATGSDWNGSLAGWQAAFPNATVHAVGFALDKGEFIPKADAGGVLGVTAGATRYTFANTRPIAAPLQLSTAYATAANIDLSSGVTDPDPNQTTSYTASNGQHGSVTLTGSTATYTPNSGFAGTDSFVYTFDDGVTQQVQALVHVTVAKASSATTLRFAPAHPTTAQKPSAIVTVTSAGVVNGGTVTVKVGTSRFTGTVSRGKATVPMRRLRAGPHKVTATFHGTATAASSSTSATLRVTRA